VIVGKIGAASVLISTSKVQDLEYIDKMGCYEAFLEDGSNYRIEVGRAIRAKVTEFSIEAGNYLFIQRFK
jgi:DNA-directed RNA polymerase subunit E'/Rpb7